MCILYIGYLNSALICFLQSLLKFNMSILSARDLIKGHMYAPKCAYM
jgi:hypothetical protein